MDREERPEIQETFTLEEILEEFSSSRTREEGLAPPAPPPGGGSLGDTKVIRFPTRPERDTPQKQPAPERKPPAREDASKARQATPQAQEEAPQVQEDAPEAEQTPHSQGRVAKLWARLRSQANDFAARMFETEEPDPEEQEAERYLPGVDEERPRRLRRPAAPKHRPARIWPDTPPQDLAVRYGRGLGGLRVRRLLVLLLALPLLYLSLAGPLTLPLPGVLAQTWLQIWVCAGVHAAALALSYDLVADGFRHFGANTLTVLASLATLADACTMGVLGDREGSLPYSLVCVLALSVGLWGRELKRSALRTCCRTAAGAKSPYIVTLDEDKWDGRAAFTKWVGTVDGFGSQIQADDCAEIVFRPAAALLGLACLLFSTIASVGRGRGALFLWCLSATLCAAATLSGALAFALPFHTTSRRLAGVGAALAGWEGVRRQEKGAGILLTDTDLFPPGAVVLNGVKVFQGHSLETVISDTATLIRAMGSGLDRTFHDLVRTQGTIYRRFQALHCYEGGASAMIQGEQIFVGSAAFLHLMKVALPQGLNVKNAVFCAIDGELAGIFALSYSLHATVRPSLGALIGNRISPILATRDFNLIPAMLHQRFKLPAEKMEFPEQERRRALSDPRQRHDRPMVCVLCREGIGPLSEAVVGAKRLYLAARVNCALAVLGCVVGVLLTFYLTAQAAFASLSVLSLLVYLLMWLVPTLLISGWVNKY
jgi:hypothetical protein